MNQAKFGHGETGGRRRTRSLGAVLAAVLFLGAAPVAAHGPTVQITHTAMKPALLNLHVGTTVHFNNAESMPGGHTVVDHGGTLESPPLGPVGDGWHYTFETPGTYELFIQQHPAAHMRIVVIPKP